MHSIWRAQESRDQMIESDTFTFQKLVEKFRVDIKMRAFDGCLFSFCDTHNSYDWTDSFSFRETHNYGLNIAFIEFMFGTGLSLLQFL